MNSFPLHFESALVRLNEAWKQINEEREREREREREKGGKEEECILTLFILFSH